MSDDLWIYRCKCGTNKGGSHFAQWRRDHLAMICDRCHHPVEAINIDELIRERDAWAAGKANVVRDLEEVEAERDTLIRRPPGRPRRGLTKPREQAMQTKTTKTGFGILVIERGNVIVGEFEMSDSDEMITVRDGKVIRRWGTTKGLGELASGGPTSDTVLDPLNRTGYVRKGALVFVIDCDPEQWR